MVQPSIDLAAASASSNAFAHRQRGLEGRHIGIGGLLEHRELMTLSSGSPPTRSAAASTCARPAARGRSDFGVNAARIRAYMGALRKRIG